jgi:hypothetical protein
MASNRKPEELLPTASADRAAGVRLSKSEEIRVNHSPGKSTYPDEKSVLTSEATPGPGLAFKGVLEFGPEGFEHQHLKVREFNGRRVKIRSLRDLDEQG